MKTTFEEMGENLGASLPDFLLAIPVRVGVTRLTDNILWESSGFWST